MYFAAVTTLLVEELDRYFQQYLDTLSNGLSAVCDVTHPEMFQLERYLTVNETVLHTFVCKPMKSDKFFFVDFSVFQTMAMLLEIMTTNCDRVWRLRHLFSC
jgi:hypothetical protein